MTEDRSDPLGRPRSSTSLGSFWLRCSTWRPSDGWHRHLFTLPAAPNELHVRVTVKAGDYTTSVKTVKVGMPAVLERAPRPLHARMPPGHQLWTWGRHHAVPGLAAVARPTACRPGRRVPRGPRRRAVRRGDPRPVADRTRRRFLGPRPSRRRDGASAPTTCWSVRRRPGRRDCFMCDRSRCCAPPTPGSPAAGVPAGRILPRVLRLALRADDEVRGGTTKLSSRVGIRRVGRRNRARLPPRAGATQTAATTSSPPTTIR